MLAINQIKDASESLRPREEIDQVIKDKDELTMLKRDPLQGDYRKET